MAYWNTSRSKLLWVCISSARNRRTAKTWPLFHTFWGKCQGHLYWDLQNTLFWPHDDFFSRSIGNQV